MTFPDAARAVLRDTGDEYLRLRLRKSKAIRFNRRERRNASPASIFPFLPRYADYTTTVTFLRYATAIDMLYRAETKDGKFIISLALQKTHYL